MSGIPSFRSCYLYMQENTRREREQMSKQEKDRATLGVIDAMKTHAVGQQATAEALASAMNLDLICRSELVEAMVNLINTREFGTDAENMTTRREVLFELIDFVKNWGKK